jgi:hypothetical protein
MNIILRAFVPIAAIAGFGTLALAQTPSDAPKASAVPSMPPATSARAACRTQIDSQSLTGDQRKSAMRDCMKPHRDACRQQAAEKGLPKGPDRKAFMHQCMQGA